MAKNPKWSTEELEILARVYPQLGTSPNITEYFPGRTLNGVLVKARRSGLKNLVSPNKHREDKEYLALLVNTNFKSLEPYINNRTAILHECKVCGHTYSTTPERVLKPGAICAECSRRNRILGLDKVIQGLQAKGFTLISSYVSADSPIRVSHSTCGKE